MSDYPTASYISQYPDVYDNPNLTTWTEAGMPLSFPRPGSPWVDGILQATRSRRTD